MGDKLYWQTPNDVAVEGASGSGGLQLAQLVVGQFAEESLDSVLSRVVSIETPKGIDHGCRGHLRRMMTFTHKAEHETGDQNQGERRAEWAGITVVVAEDARTQRARGSGMRVPIAEGRTWCSTGAVVGGRAGETCNVIEVIAIWARANMFQRTRQMLGSEG